MAQPFDPAADSAAIAQATAALLATIRTLSDAAVAAPSALPGWSRGHVLTHIARNADGYARCLRGAALGVPTPAYDSRESRDADIERGSGRPLAEQLADVEAASGRFAEAVASLQGGGWDSGVPMPDGSSRPARLIPEGRLREVAIHHVDLLAGYTCRDWSAPLAGRILTSLAERFDTLGMPPLRMIATDADVDHRFADGAEPSVRGRAGDLAWWLLGRGDASLLDADGALPAPPAWR